jgi:hypothetical protein
MYKMTSAGALLYELIAQHPAGIAPIVFTYADGLTSHRGALAVFCATTRPWRFRMRWADSHLMRMELERGTTKGNAWRASGIVLHDDDHGVMVEVGSREFAHAVWKQWDFEQRNQPWWDHVFTPLLGLLQQ